MSNLAQVESKLQCYYSHFEQFKNMCEDRVIVMEKVYGNLKWYKYKTDIMVIVMTINALSFLYSFFFKN